MLLLENVTFENMFYRFTSDCNGLTYVFLIKLLLVENTLHQISNLRTTFISHFIESYGFFIS